MTEQDRKRAALKACFRLGVPVYLRSPGTDSVWELEHDPFDWSGKHKGEPAYRAIPVSGEAQILGAPIIRRFLSHFPEYFSTNPPTQHPTHT